MMKRRQLTIQQAESARFLLQIWNERKVQLGLTQKKAADMLGITQSAIGQYLHGIIPLNTDTVIKFARLLGVAPSEISPDTAEKFDVVGPVIAHAGQESIEISPDEFEWIKMMRRLWPSDRNTIKRIVAALVQSEEHQNNGM
ncbi:MAG: helix-turn-helix domain-containing protein [Candidatus Competibacteraceae bacterium]